jgi:hypothetical protein
VHEENEKAKDMSSLHIGTIPQLCKSGKFSTKVLVNMGSLMETLKIR